MNNKLFYAGICCIVLVAVLFFVFKWRLNG